MGESTLTETEALVQYLQPDNWPATKLRAAEQLGELQTSCLEIVQALIAAKESDPAYLVRSTSAKALESPVHQEILRRHPDLLRRATSEVTRPSEMVSPETTAALPDASRLNPFAGLQEQDADIEGEIAIEQVLKWQLIWGVTGGALFAIAGAFIGFYSDYIGDKDLFWRFLEALVFGKIIGYPTGVLGIIVGYLIGVPVVVYRVGRSFVQEGSFWFAFLGSGLGAAIFYVLVQLAPETPHLMLLAMGFSPVLAIFGFYLGALLKKSRGRND